MDVFEDKTKRYRKQVTKLGGNNALRSKPRATMFVVSFTILKSRALSRDPAGDRKVRVSVQASHGNITALVMHRASLLDPTCTRFSRHYKTPVRDFPQTKLDSIINAHFLLDEHGDPTFFS